MKRRNVILLFSGLILMLTSAVASTVAWYVEGADLYVNYVNISFVGEKNLLISNRIDEDSFKEQLEKEDLNYVDKFNPVSSAESDKWLNDKEVMPKFKLGYDSNSEFPKSISASSGFFSQELYLLSDDDIYATIDKNDLLFEPNKEKNLAIAKTIKGNFPDLTVDEIYENLNNINKSLRISILIPDEEYYSYTIIDPYKSDVTYLGGIMDSDDDSYFDNYRKNNISYETVYGDITNRDKLVYDDAPGADIKATGQLTCFNAHRKGNVKQFNLEKSIENGAVIPTEDSITLDEVESKLMIPVDSYEPRKIVLSIYLEGWDLDNTNLVSYASFLVNLKFKILKIKEML